MTPQQKRLPKYSTLKAKLDKVFSIYIRTRDSLDGQVVCCTCPNVLPIKEIHCGHFMSRRYLNTRWCAENAAGQCPGCNMFKNGEQYKFGIYIDNRWGDGMAKIQERLSRKQVKFSRIELQDMIEGFEAKLKEYEN